MLWLRGGGDGDRLRVMARQRRFARRQARSWLAAARAAVEARAHGDGRAVRDYASTLVAAILRDDESLFVQIGDGVMVAQGADHGGWAWVFWPEHGEYANETRFLCDDHAITSAQVEHNSHRIVEIAVMTDGIERLVLSYAAKAVHQPFFRPQHPGYPAVVRAGGEHAPVAGIGRLSKQSPINERTDDDVTLVLASRLWSGEDDLAALASGMSLRVVSRVISAGCKRRADRARRGR